MPSRLEKAELCSLIVNWCHQGQFDLKHELEKLSLDSSVKTEKCEDHSRK